MKSLLILTGHSKGLGKAILERFLAEKNIQIVAISRSILDVRYPNLTQIAQDLSDLIGLEAKLPEIFPAGNFDKIILINNAGWIGEVKPVGMLQPTEMEKAMKLNLLAPMILTDGFVKAYSRLNIEKLICNISSGAARKPMPGWAEYCSGKAGLEMFSKVASEDLREKGFSIFRSLLASSIPGCSGRSGQPILRIFRLWIASKTSKRRDTCRLLRSWPKRFFIY